MLQLLHGEVWKLQRHRGKAQEAVRVRGAPGGQRFVVDRDHVCSEVTVRPVPERVDADGLDIDALGVHLAEAAQADFADPRTAALVGACWATHEF